MSATLKNVYAPAPAVTRGKPVHFGAHPKGTHFIYAAARNIVIRSVTVNEKAKKKRSKNSIFFLFLMIFLCAKNPLESDVYTEHSSEVTVGKYSPSGFYIASGDANGKVRIWDTVNKEHILKIELPVLAGPVLDLAWTEDSKRIVAVGDGREQFGAAFMFDSGSTVGEIIGHSKTINTCDVKQSRPYRAVTGGLDNLVNFFPGAPFKFEKSNKEHQRFVNCVRYSPDGNFYISAGSDKKLCVYDGKTGDFVRELAGEKDGGHTAGIYSLSWNAASTKVLTASADKTSKIFDVASGKCEQTFAFGTDTDNQQLGCLWVGATLISLSLGGEISFLDQATGEPKHSLVGHSKTVTALAFDKTDDAIYSGDATGRTIRWDAATARNRIVGGAAHTNQVQSIVIDGDTVVSAGMDDTVRIANRAQGSAYSKSVPTEGLPSDVSAKQGVIAVSTNKAVQLIRNGAVVATVKLAVEGTSVAVSPDGKHVAVGCADNIVRIYAAGAAALTHERDLTGHRGPVTAVEFSPDGTKIASVCKQRQVMVWHANNGASIITDQWTFHTATPLDISWAPGNLLFFFFLFSSLSFPPLACDDTQIIFFTLS
jgi:WD40 repeat protein